MFEIFKVALLRKGMSQSELAARLGLHSSTLSRFIHGWTLPSKEMQKAIKAELAPYNRGIKFGYRLRIDSNRGKESQMLNP